MDTEFTVTFADVDDATLCAAAAAAAFARLDELELLLTRFSDTSDVAVIRALKPGAVAVVARETMAVLTASAEVAAATNGAFDPTVKARSFSDLVLDVDHLRVAVKRAPVELDFGGIGKGFALDEMAALLGSEQFGLGNWLLDAGTSTLLASGGPWPLGVGGAWKARTRLPTVLRLSSGALSGSGFEIQGAHIFDPRTGEPAARWAQSWARARTAAVADALSTAALSMEPAELKAAAATLDAAVLVARRQRPVMDHFRDPLKWYGKP
ncbi:MAG: FAD:protein FMN transferase [Kiritimatiellae bacterium]|nr:FAD:protein FMN transferase [Kiritimatiellia bacterium]